MFKETTRKCGFCHAVGCGFMACARCKVYVYCSKTCQAAHWGSAHKKTCKALVPPPDEKETAIPRRIEDDLDLEVLYKYILIKPQEDQTLDGLHKTTCGIAESICLDSLVECDSVEDLDGVVLSELQLGFGLGPDIATCVVAGYSFEYDGQHQLLAYYNETSSSAGQPDNATASSVLMKLPGEVRGNAILVARKRVQPEKLAQDQDQTQVLSQDLAQQEDTPTGDDSNHNTVASELHQGSADRGPVRQESFSLTRRQVIDLAIYNSSCGGAGCVSRRVHFENIRRKEILLNFKKQEYQLFDEGV